MCRRKAFGNGLHFRIVHYCDLEGTAYVKGIRGQSAKKDIWAKRDGLIRKWRRLHNKELHDLYSSSNFYLGDKIKKHEMRGARGMYGRQERCIQGVGGKT
jgi:hypothetical protein